MLFDIRDYLMGRLSRPKDSAGKSGAEITGNCPFCDRYGGFYANATTGKYVCFKCDARGRSVLGLVAQLEDIDQAAARAFVFRNSVELRRRADIFTLADRVRSLRPHAITEDEPEAVEFDMPPGVRPCFNSRTRKWSLPPYLKQRRLKSRTVAAWKLGYCTRLTLDVPGREKPFFMRDRLFIPIECPAGRSWTARDMTGEQTPKYLNPPGADHRRLLIGWNQAKLTGDLVICEGPLDVIKLWQHDVAAVALGGKELHDEQLAQLMDLPRELAVTVMLDPEEKTAPLNVASRLSVHFESVYVAKLPIVTCKACAGDGCDVCGGTGNENVDPGAASREQVQKSLDKSTKWKGSRVAMSNAVIERSRIALASKWGRKKSA